jgi:hypothetical protein
MNMNQEENIKRLQDPFIFKDVEWKIQYTNQNKTSGMAVPYLNSRAIQTRLDEAIGAANWKNSYTPWQTNAQLCGLSIYDSERKEWVAKYDGAENTDIEAVKGGLSDSFKRAACLWGIGRYLYELGGIWVEIESSKSGKSSVIKADQYPKLEDEYNKAVIKIFYNTGANQEKPSVAPAEQKPLPVSPAADNAKPAVAAKSSDYRVQSVKPSGKKSQLVELVNASSGEVVSAYIQKSDDAVKAGSTLKEVDIVVKDSSYGQYNMINGYKIAA